MSKRRNKKAGDRPVGDITPISLASYYGPDEPFADEISALLTDMGALKSSPTLFRDEIIKQICSILISSSKCNALLVGPAGSGKTNIVEELAKRIRRKHRSVPRQLLGYKIFSINLSDIVSGCGLVGELERKVRTLVDYLECEDNKAILFFDEVHMLFGSETYKKVAQILKPALSRGRFKVIAATTTQEVKKVEEDPAFSRRFTRVLVDELSCGQTRTVLRRAVKRMEKHYGAKIAFNADVAELLVRTADEFCMVGSHRPDNALTLMDRAIAARVIETGAGGTGAVIELDRKLVERTAFLMTSGNCVRNSFDEKNFMRTLSKVRGQDDIVSDIVKRIKLYDLHLRERKAPLTFLFAGPSGVGKSEIAKIIAKEYVGEKPIILNMAEFHSSASINRIIGAPSGYAGSDSNRELPFDALDTNPYQVIILDEFEKCDRSVQRLFMSAFDEGTMKTALGKEIDFSKTIIIATTNAGCTGSVGAIGFGASDDGERLTTSELSGYFDVELLNRFTKRYTFHSINREVYRKVIEDILDEEMTELKAGRLGEVLADFFDRTVSERDIDGLVDDTYDFKLGARPARRSVRDFIDALLLECLENRQLSILSAGRGNGKRKSDYAYELKSSTVA